ILCRDIDSVQIIGARLVPGCPCPERRDSSGRRVMIDRHRRPGTTTNAYVCTEHLSPVGMALAQHGVKVYRSFRSESLDGRLFEVDFFRPERKTISPDL